jgi:hypothetical protein
MENNFEPPQTIIQGKKTYTYKESKTTNSKGERLSEICYWYECNGKLEPLSKGNIEYLKKPLY